MTTSKEPVEEHD
jgi:hypothetical protein